MYDFNYLHQGGNVFAGFCLFVCLSVSPHDKSKSYRRIFLKFWGYVGHGINYQWSNFGHDPAGILDSGSLWNFRYHCVKKGIRKPLAKRRWWRHLVNSFALAEVPAGYDCFLVIHACKINEKKLIQSRNQKLVARAVQNFFLRLLKAWKNWDDYF